MTLCITNFRPQFLSLSLKSPVSFISHSRFTATPLTLSLSPSPPPPPPPCAVPDPAEENYNTNLTYHFFLNVAFSHPGNKLLFICYLSLVPVARKLLASLPITHEMPLDYLPLLPSPLVSVLCKRSKLSSDSNPNRDTRGLHKGPKNPNSLGRRMQFISRPTHPPPLFPRPFCLVPSLANQGLGPPRRRYWKIKHLFLPEPRADDPAFRPTSEAGDRPVKEGRAAGGPTLDSSKPTHQWSLVPKCLEEPSFSPAPLILSFPFSFLF